ncbi:MAG: arginine--tRNA ligase [Planctomycetaceae bacterium]|jgi:arginyl-tRNA synthetase|nr:arginine--tRNA ligase [Planctomycetaceae bacterium]
MILNILKEHFAAALLPLTGEAADSGKTRTAPLLDLIRPSQEPKFGDFQANMSMPLAKQLGKPPRDVAKQIVDALQAAGQLAGICETPEIAGPGFINLRLKNGFLIKLLQKAAADEERLGIPPLDLPKQKTYIVDYSGPNVAKPMHVGHIRSTVIGNALAKMLRFQGHKVITDNHLGDWGTQFGMIIFGYRNYLDKDAYQKNPVEELSRIYRLVRQKVDEPNEEIAAAVLAETAKLHGGDPDNLAIWQEVLPYSKDEINRIYRRFNITFDHTLGESFYQPMLAGVVNDLLKRKIASETEGAVGVFFDGDKVPMLIRKKDGAFLYGTTDLATVEYRLKEFKPDAILYVVDFRQTLHFEHLFKTVRLTGIENVELTHVKFGTVLGEDGKPFKTRSGDTVGLNGLLDEAEHRALEIVTKNSSEENETPETNSAVHKEIARRIGIGAVIYADISQNRESDYVFSYEKMLAMNGNTAAYMQYAFARIKSIFAKGNIDIAAIRRQSNMLQLTQPAERALALELLKFGEALDFALRDYRPNILTAYLYELANRYSVFFEQCPVLKAESEEVRTSRLLLCDLTARTIQKGLELLGIETVERM